MRLDNFAPRYTLFPKQEKSEGQPTHDPSLPLGVFIVSLNKLSYFYAHQKQNKTKSEDKNVAQ
jgi:hypothetical protein